MGTLRPSRCLRIEGRRSRGIQRRILTEGTGIVTVTGRYVEVETAPC